MAHGCGPRLAPGLFTEPGDKTGLRLSPTLALAPRGFKFDRRLCSRYSHREAGRGRGQVEASEHTAGMAAGSSLQALLAALINCAQ